MDQEIERRDGESRSDPHGCERQPRRDCATMGFTGYKFTPKSDTEKFITVLELLHPKAELKTDLSEGDATKPKSSAGLTEEELDALLDSDQDE